MLQYISVHMVQFGWPLASCGVLLWRKVDCLISEVVANVVHAYGRSSDTPPSLSLSPRCSCRVSLSTTLRDSVSQKCTLIVLLKVATARSSAYNIDKYQMGWLEWSHQNRRMDICITIAIIAYTIVLKVSNSRKAFWTSEGVLKCAFVTVVACVPTVCKLYGM